MEYSRVQAGPATWLVLRSILLSCVRSWSDIWALSSRRLLRNVFGRLQVSVTTEMRNRELPRTRQNSASSLRGAHHPDRFTSLLTDRGDTYHAEIIAILRAYNQLVQGDYRC